MELAAVLLVAFCAAAPSDEDPLSDDDLALVEALTSSAATGMMEDEVLVADEEPSQTLGRTAAQALESLPNILNSYRAGEILALRLDGVRLPFTHAAGRLRDGWLTIDPGAIGQLEWRAAAGSRSPGLGAALALSGRQPPRNGGTTSLRLLTRSADGGVGFNARAGYGDERRGIVAVGRFETLPTLRQSATEDQALGDRLGEQWSVQMRATEIDPGLSVGVDWARRQNSRLSAAPTTRQARVDHGLAFFSAGGDWGHAIVAYLTDEVVGDSARSTDRAQADAALSWALTEALRLRVAGFGRYDDQGFIDSNGTSRRGESYRAEPAIGLHASWSRLRVDLVGRWLWGRTTSDGLDTVDASEPLLFLEASGPLGVGFGWRAAVHRSAHLPQPWNLDTSNATRPETSWTAELGPTFVVNDARIGVTVFAQQVRNHWSRAALVRPQQTPRRFRLLGVETEVVWSPVERLELAATAAWASGDSSEPPTALRPTTSQVRGFFRTRYTFSGGLGFAQAHGRFITGPVGSRDFSGPDLGLASPVRVGLMGEVRLGPHVTISVSVDNVLDLDYDDPLVVGDRIGLDARLAVTLTPFSAERP